jgi:hypothetical protein
MGQNGQDLAFAMLAGQFMHNGLGGSVNLQIN